MLRRENAPLQKVTLNLVKGDFAFLQEKYPELGAGKIVRELVRALVKKQQEKDSAIRSSVDVDIGEVTDNI